MFYFYLLLSLLYITMGIDQIIRVFKNKTMYHRAYHVFPALIVTGIGILILVLLFTIA